MTVWNALLIVYCELNVRLRYGHWRRRPFHQVATRPEIIDAVESFRAFPQLVAELTAGAAQVEPSIVEVDAALRSLTEERGPFFWPSPDDTRRELDRFAPAGSYKSIFIFGRRTILKNAQQFHVAVGGLGMAASDWSNRSTYAVVANAPSSAWNREAPGEVWLHEWLHGVCHHFAEQGHTMPTPDADGAEVHGYKRSQTVGWTDYYRDLLTGNVMENGKLVGIPRNAWQQRAEPAV